MIHIIYFDKKFCTEIQFNVLKASQSLFNGHKMLQEVANCQAASDTIV